VCRAASRNQKKSQRHRSRNQDGRRTFTAKARSSQRSEFLFFRLYLCVSAVPYPDASFHKCLYGARALRLSLSYGEPLRAVSIFHVLRQGLFGGRRRSLGLRQIRPGVSDLTQKLLSRFKGFAGEGSLMAMVTLSIGPAMAAVTVDNSVVRISRVGKQK
jgi:hypothetical protein